MTSRPLLAAISGLTAFAALFVPGFLHAQGAAPVASRPAGDIGKEYRQRFIKLDPDNVQGHYELAEWCRQQGNNKLAYEQARYVLKLNPKHENAKLVARIARRSMRTRVTGDEGKNEAEPKQPRIRAGAPGEYLSDKDIQKLRWAEFQDLPFDVRDWSAESLDRSRDRDREPDRSEDDDRRPNVMESLKVTFKKDMLNDFLDAMSGHQEFSRREDRTRFLELPATRQTQLIRFYTANRYADRIKIHNDPLAFREFKRVLPTVMRGCGALSCHGGSEIKSFRLRTSRPNSAANLYTNYLILNRVSTGKEWLISRDKPTESLLLEYGLPAQHAKHTHPEEIPPVFYRGPSDPKYRTILRWIETLRVPYPRTDISLPGFPERPAPGSSLGGRGTDKKAAPAPKQPPAKQ